MCEEGRKEKGEKERKGEREKGGREGRREGGRERDKDAYMLSHTHTYRRGDSFMGLQ